MYVHFHSRQQMWNLSLLLPRGSHLQCKTRELNRGKIRKTQTIHCPNTTLVLKKVCSLFHRRAFVVGALKVTTKLGVNRCSNFRVAFDIALHIALAFASCNCCCCHDPFSVRNSNLSTIHWFHSACTSVSMFTINVHNCLFLCS